MNDSATGLKALAAAAVCAAALAACATDPVTDSVRPTAADKGQSEHAPAGAYGALLRVAEATRQAGDPASALPMFRRAHNADLFKPAALVGIGQCLSELGQFNDAGQAFRDALALDHNNTEALRGLGSTLVGLNQPELAIDQFKAANTIEPDYRNFNGLGVASDHLGDHKQAQEYYAAGLKTFPNNMTLLNNLGLSQILSRDYDGAIATLVSAAQQPGAGPRQRQNLALAYGLAGRNDDAARVSRLDLGSQAVDGNLAYYGILRAADDNILMSAIMGVQVPMKPASGPAPKPEAAADPAATGANGEPKQPAPQADAAPTRSFARIVRIETAPITAADAAQPMPQAESSKSESAKRVTTADVAADKPLATAAGPVPAPVKAPTKLVKPAESVAKAVPAPSKPAEPEPVSSVIPIVTPAPQAAASDAAPPASAPAQTQEKTQSDNSTLTGNVQTAAEAVPAPGPTPAVIITGLADQQPLPSETAALPKPTPAKVRLPQTRDPAPSWYAGIQPAAGPTAAKSQSFLDKAYDFFFKPLPKNQVAAANYGAAPSITAPDNDASLRPASGPETVSPEWRGDVASIFRERRDAIPHRPENTPATN
jgi:Flp pilus assembly protein TadD